MSLMPIFSPIIANNPFANSAQVYAIGGTYTWTCPASGVSSIPEVIVRGAGGGGTSRSMGSGGGGAGGGNGSKANVPVTASSNYTVVVGTGGTAGTGSGGGNGGNSSFNGTAIVGTGGQGGTQDDTNATGGSGTGTGVTSHTGGEGGTGNNTGGGGGGGGGAGDTSDGGGGTNDSGGTNNPGGSGGTSAFGYPGGSGGISGGAIVNEAQGNWPGGGGGGINAGPPAVVGADGAVILYGVPGGQAPITLFTSAPVSTSLTITCDLSGSGTPQYKATWWDGTSTSLTNSGGSVGKSANGALNMPIQLIPQGSAVMTQIIASNQGISFVANLYGVPSLTNLSLSLNQFPSIDLTGDTGLITLDVHNNSVLTTLIGFGTLTSLGSLDIQSCTALTSFPPILSSLQSLLASVCTHITAPPILTNATGLHLMELDDCSAMTGTLDISACTSLQTLLFNGSGISAFNTGSVSTVAAFECYQCPNLTSLNIDSFAANLGPSGFSAFGCALTSVSAVGYTGGISTSSTAATCDISHNNLSAAALNSFFSGLGTGTNTYGNHIIVTGNPGAATCNTSIATAKGYTVTT